MLSRTKQYFLASKSYLKAERQRIFTPSCEFEEEGKEAEYLAMHIFTPSSLDIVYRPQIELKVLCHV